MKCGCKNKRWTVRGCFRVLRVSQVSCLVLGLLVLPTASPLVPGVSAGEGVVAFGLGVGGGAGVGVAVTGPGFGRGWLGVAGCGRLPLLAEGLVAFVRQPCWCLW